MTAEKLQQEIDSMTGREFIMIYGRIYENSKFPDFWKISRAPQPFYAVSGPDFILFGKKIKVEQAATGYFTLKVYVEENDLVGHCYLKNVYQVNINRPTENTAEASA